MFKYTPLLSYSKSQSVEEALFSAEKEKWKAAMQKMDSIYSNDVRDLVELPKDCKTIGSEYSNKNQCCWVNQLLQGSVGHSRIFATKWS